MGSYYDLLDVPIKASQAEIKKAYRKLVLELHPDRNPVHGTHLNDLMHEINHAYQILSDPIQRAEYDECFYPKSTNSSLTFIKPIKDFLLKILYVILPLSGAISVLLLKDMLMPSLIYDKTHLIYCLIASILGGAIASHISKIIRLPRQESTAIGILLGIVVGLVLAGVITIPNEEVSLYSRLFFKLCTGCGIIGALSGIFSTRFAAIKLIKTPSIRSVVILGAVTGAFCGAFLAWSVTQALSEDFIFQMVTTSLPTSFNTILFTITIFSTSIGGAFTAAWDLAYCNS